MYLQSVFLKNFQSWKRAKIYFDVGFNAIIGDSDSGKSSITRAISWVVKNRPPGESFKSWFSEKNEKTTVLLRFNDGHVSKERLAGKSVYKVSSLEQPLKAFGTDVPDEVKKMVDMEDHNLQEQHKDYFLLQETPGERAKIFNKIVGLDIIDKLFSFLTSKSLDVTRSLKRAEETKEKIKKDLEHFENLDEMQAIIAELKKEAKQFDTKEKIIKNGWALLHNVEKIQRDIKLESERLEIEKELTPLASHAEAYRLLKGKVDKGRESLNNVLKLRKEQMIIGLNLQEDIREYVKILSENKVCPTCGSSITKTILEEIKDRL